MESPFEVLLCAAKRQQVSDSIGKSAIRRFTHVCTPGVQHWVLLMRKVLAIRRNAPFGPEQTRAMGVAFDVAWRILESKSWIADQHVDETRAQLGRRIVELAQRGES